MNQYGGMYNPLAADSQQRRIDLRNIPRPINNLSGGMATQPQLGTAMGIANQIYGMQQ